MQDRSEGINVMVYFCIFDINNRITIKQYEL